MRFIRIFILLALLLGLPVLAQRDSERTIRLGDTIQGLLSTDEREVAYTFEGERGQFVIITMIKIGEMDPYLRLEDDSGTVLIQDDDSAGSLNSRIGPFRLPESGPYTIIATSLHGRDVGEFTLSLQAQAIRRVEYGQRITGELTGEETQVEYTFNAEAGTIISIDLMSDNFDATLRLLEGRTRAQLVYNDDGGIKRDSRIGPYVLPDTGEYQIVASGLGSPSGEYVLTLTRVDPVPIEMGDALATHISGGQAIYFAFEGQAGDVIDVRLDTGNTFDTALAVITPSTNDLAGDDNVNDDIDPVLTNVILSETGTYFLVVQPGVSRDARTPITVKVTESIVSSLDDGPQTIRFSTSRFSHLLRFTGEANERVLVRLTFDTRETVSPTVRVNQRATELASFSSSNITGELSFGLRIPEDGSVLIEVQDYGYRDLAVSVSVERE